MVPLADIFNHKASLVLLGDAWGVAEAMAAGEGGEGGDSSAPSSEDVEQSSGGGEAGADAAEGEEQEQEGEGESSEGEGESEGDEDDTQHGFAVGGMPLIQVAGGTAAAAGEGGGHRHSGLLLTAPKHTCACRRHSLLLTPQPPCPTATAGCTPSCRH
jgi:hypothetical protein